MFISIEKDGIYLNGRRILSSEAKKQYTFLNSLLKTQVDGTLSGEKFGLKRQRATEYMYSNNKQILEEQQIKQIVYNIRKNITTIHGKNICDDFIKYDSSRGYFLSDKTVLILK